MKKIILLSFLAFFITAKSQIVFEFDYDSASTYAGGAPAYQDQLMIVNFEVSGDQYVKVNRHGKKVCVYDMSHALVKTIDYSGFPYGSTANNATAILYLSELLFDSDPGMEFMYIAGSNPTPYTGIYNDDGSLIFSDTGAAIVIPNWAMQQYPIYNTTSGTKMILSYQNGHAKVFSLTGTLTTAIYKANTTLANMMVSNAHPNPSVTTTNIDYKLPDNVNQGEIVFYDLLGAEIKRVKVDRTFDSLLISTADMPAGTYYYQLQIGSDTSAGKKIVVVK